MKRDRNYEIYFVILGAFFVILSAAKNLANEESRYIGIHFAARSLSLGEAKGSE